jgi:hypothetical protein
MNMRGMGCALHVRCALSIYQKECWKSWGARYLPENTVIIFTEIMKEGAVEPLNGLHFNAHGDLNSWQ